MSFPETRQGTDVWEVTLGIQLSWSRPGALQPGYYEELDILFKELSALSTSITSDLKYWPILGVTLIYPFYRSLAIFIPSKTVN